MAEKLIELMFAFQKKYNSLVPDKDGLAEFLIANDVVPVVRCKVCEYAVGHDEIHKTVLCQKRSAYPQQWDEMPFDGFCSYGERKDNG